MVEEVSKIFLGTRSTGFNIVAKYTCPTSKQLVPNSPRDIIILVKFVNEVYQPQNEAI